MPRIYPSDYAVEYAELIARSTYRIAHPNEDEPEHRIATDDFMMALTCFGRKHWSAKDWKFSFAHQKSSYAKRQAAKQ